MGQEVAKVKKILRQQIREAMAELTDQERAWSDGELIQRFLEHPKLAEAHTVLLYYGVGQEVATAGLIQTLLDQGKTVCLPKCLPEYQMEARAITALEDLVPDQYDIPAPKDGCPVVAREELDLIPVSYTHLDVYKRQAPQQVFVVHGDAPVTEIFANTCLLYTSRCV